MDDALLAQGFAENAIYYHYQLTTKLRQEPITLPGVAAPFLYPDQRRTMMSGISTGLSVILSDSIAPLAIQSCFHDIIRELRRYLCKNMRPNHGSKRSSNAIQAWKAHPVVRLPSLHSRFFHFFIKHCLRSIITDMSPGPIEVPPNLLPADDEEMDSISARARRNATKLYLLNKGYPLMPKELKNPMEGIKNQILADLELHRERDWAQLRVSLNLSNFMRSQYGPNEASKVEIGHLITLSGSSLHTQATTCADYVQQFWPSSGLRNLNLIQRALETGPGASTGTLAAIVNLCNANTMQSKIMKICVYSSTSRTLTVIAKLRYRFCMDTSKLLSSLPSNWLGWEPPFAYLRRNV